MDSSTNFAQKYYFHLTLFLVEFLTWEGRLNLCSDLTLTLIPGALCDAPSKIMVKVHKTLSLTLPDVVLISVL